MPKKQCNFNEKVIENVKEFKYLDIILSRSSCFCKAKNMCEQAQKQTDVMRQIRQLNLPVEYYKFDLFNKFVFLVSYYGCEIWGFENLDYH